MRRPTPAYSSHSPSLLSLSLSLCRYWERVLQDDKERARKKAEEGTKDSGMGIDTDMESGKFELREEKIDLRKREELRRKKQEAASDTHNSTDWSRLNLGLAKLCVGDGQSASTQRDAIDLLVESTKAFPEDVTPHFRLGQVKARSKNNSVKGAGLESLRRAHTLALRNEVKGDMGSFFVESAGSYGAAAYENSELKNATLCMDHLLRHGRNYATEEALCTKAQIMIRRGQFAEAQGFYRSIGGGEVALKGLIDSEGGGGVGDGLEPLRKDVGGGVVKLPEGRKPGRRKGAGGKGRTPAGVGYVFPAFEKTEKSGNLKWTAGERRRETLQAAELAYAADPRHISR